MSERGYWTVSEVDTDGNVWGTHRDADGTPSMPVIGVDVTRDGQPLPLTCDEVHPQCDVSCYSSHGFDVRA